MPIRTVFNMGFGALVRGSSDIFLHGLVSLTVFSFFLMNPSYLDISLGTYLSSCCVLTILLWIFPIWIFSLGTFLSLCCVCDVVMESPTWENMFFSHGSYSVPLEGQVRSIWNSKKKKSFPRPSLSFLNKNLGREVKL